MRVLRVLVIFAWTCLINSLGGSTVVAAASTEGASSAGTVRRLVDSGCLAQDKTNPSTLEMVNVTTESMVTPF